MITRVVKMSFDPVFIGVFKQVFTETQSGIKAFKGCHEVNLYEQPSSPGVFFTISKWDSEADLDAYRNSDFFAGVWERTKKGFNAKPEAWTLQHCDIK